MTNQTQTPTFAYPTHADGRRKKMHEMTDAEQDAVLAAPLESIPEDVRPKNLAVPRGFPGPRTKAWGTR